MGRVREWWEQRSTEREEERKREREARNMWEQRRWLGERERAKSRVRHGGKQSSHMLLHLAGTVAQVVVVVGDMSSVGSCRAKPKIINSLSQL